MRKKIVWIPYDMDTAIGINNEGDLVFSYNLEDTDQTGTGADVFNGQDSVIWNNIRMAFADELKAMYQSLRSNGKLSYDLIEQAFEEHQAKWPEAIFNEDAWFKYIDPLIDDGDGTYLSMAQGSKAEQRKWWLYNRFRYIDSKYNAGDALSDIIQLRGYRKADITVTPYADIYATIKYGSYLVQQRANRNTAYTLACPMDALNDTEIYIYSCSQLKSIGDISGLNVGLADFSKATRLQEAIIGSAASGYQNTNLGSGTNTLTFGNNVLLKKIDVRNCVALGTGNQKSVDISHCDNVEEVYFDGTAIQGLTLPNGGFLKKLHVPATLTNLTIMNQRSITEFVIPSYNNISTCRLENNSSVINTKAIVQAIPAATRLRLVGFSWECQDATEIESLLAIFDTMRGLDEQGNNIDDGTGCMKSISGTIHTDALTGAQIAAYKLRYPYLNVTADHTSAQLRFYNGETLITSVTVLDGGDGTYSGSTPTKSQDAQYTYTFAGWSKDTDDNTVDSDALTRVSGDRNVYACFTGTLRKYTVTWKSMGTTVETDSNVPYGSLPHFDGTMPSYDGQTASGWDRDLTQPITGDTTINAVYVPMYTVTFKTGADDGNATLASVRIAEGNTPAYSGPTPTTTRGSSTDFTFTGWTPALGPVYANTTYTAVFRDNRSPVITYLAHTIPEYESTNNTSKIAAYAFYKQSGLTRAKAPVTTVESNAFNECSALETVDLSATSGTVTIQATAFVKCTNLTHLIIRSSTKATLSNINALAETKIEKFFGAVYVPTALVDDYKADSNWKNFWIADISEYPIASFEPSETWAQIEANGAANVMIGQSKTAQIDGKQVYFTLIGKSKDDLAAGGKANSTWLMTEILENYQMNNSGTTAGGYDASKMKTHITTDLLPTFELKDMVKEVTKTSRLSDGTLQTTNEKLWLASAREMFGNGSSYESSGCVYNDFFSSDAKRVKRLNGSASVWWLRSASSSTYFWCVNNNGIAAYDDASGSNGVVLGFCL